MTVDCSFRDGLFVSFDKKQGGLKGEIEGLALAGYGRFFPEVIDPRKIS